MFEDDIRIFLIDTERRSIGQFVDLAPLLLTHLAPEHVEGAVEIVAPAERHESVLQDSVADSHVVGVGDVLHVVEVLHLCRHDEETARRVGHGWHNKIGIGLTLFAVLST